MNLQALVRRLRCADKVRDAAAASRRDAPWLRPTGLRFLDGSPPKLPDKLATKVTSL